MSDRLHFFILQQAVKKQKINLFLTNINTDLFQQ